ncbi:protein amnionless [Ascaphus truei]|uniref:protein amnionless n=1 Tax=Ascaphus truei TaxID=8439 RepID=UPI003F593E38
MGTAFFLLFLLSSIGLTKAVYKQWIPNTNFENASNWNNHRVPCSQDKVLFENGKKISVYVQSAHSLGDMYMPWDGEFILASGSGFSASSSDDPECDKGSVVTFNDGDKYDWFNPTLWHAAVSIDDLENGKFLFAVDRERVPCQHDDVIFSPETSFRVNIKTTGSAVPLRSISVMGRRFTRNEDFAQHLESNTGKLQFPGPGSLQVTDTKCKDKTGCECGHNEVLQEICSALLQHTGNKCPDVSCANPLKPLGHCCEICGATVSLEYTSDFDIANYRNRLIHTFLSLAKYSGVKMAISKVQKPQSVLGIIPRDSVPEIQIVLIDDKSGTQTGSGAQQLAYDIMSDITNHGKSFGIVKGKILIAIGSTTGAHDGHMAAGTVTGIVIGIILGVSLLGAILFLYRMGIMRWPFFEVFLFWKTYQLEADLEIKGFENPIFAPTIENTDGLFTAEDALKGVPLRESGTQFSNPLYDDSQFEV